MLFEKVLLGVQVNKMVYDSKCCCIPECQSVDMERCVERSTSYKNNCPINESSEITKQISKRKMCNGAKKFKIIGLSIVEVNLEYMYKIKQKTRRKCLNFGDLQKLANEHTHVEARGEQARKSLCSSSPKRIHNRLLAIQTFGQRKFIAVNQSTTPKMKLTAKQLRMFPKIQHKFQVSASFLKSNKRNIQRFLWRLMSPRAVIQMIAIRKVRRNRVVIKFGQLRHAVWHVAERRRIKMRKRNIQLWSLRMVRYLRELYGVREHMEERPIKCGVSQSEEISQKLKEQLELLRSGQRNYVALIQQQQQQTVTNIGKDGNAKENTNALNAAKDGEGERKADEEEQVKNITTDLICTTVSCTNEVNDGDAILETVNSVQQVQNENADITNTTNDLESQSRGDSVALGVNVKARGNFLDILMSKVGMHGIRSKNQENGSSLTLSNDSTTCNVERDRKVRTYETGQYTDSGDEFLGFEESPEELVPGMLMTPRVPSQNMSKRSSEHVAFVSESLDKYLRENALVVDDEDDSQHSISDLKDKKKIRKFREANHDGLVTPGCTPPSLEMPVIPESLQRLRTVAERRQYLQRFAKNHKLTIINNEAMVYRELQRKLKPNKSKYVSQQLLQAINSQMPFTRNGWQAASFVATEYNCFYYQKIEVHGNTDVGCDENQCMVLKLPGVRGNNEELYKPNHHMYSPKTDNVVGHCHRDCIDAQLWQRFKSIKTVKQKEKLNKDPPKSIFKPCPLSQKPFQKPLDDETAALLLAGGSMAVVRMPTVELEVFPMLGKQLHEIAKRYLQYILPHYDITREWAEFSVSTLQVPPTMREAEAIAAAATKDLNGGRQRKSFTFAIPYLNDRNKILVRRVIDRSEKLDDSFELAQSCDGDNDGCIPSSVLDLSFRSRVNLDDEIEVACADVVNEMINCVAISCSENSFIRDDPDNIYASGYHRVSTKGGYDELTGFPTTRRTQEKFGTAVGGKTIVQHKKQNRLLMELRRLNATIIDAATKAENESKPCPKAYCVLGCVCDSLIGDIPMRQHCGKSKCVVECNCKHHNQAQIMRLDTDGRAISTEDAFMLRRKATARLARMEKEFTSTVVLTENETLVINESQYDKKRRCTKAPKRYEDFADTEDDYTTRITTSPKKQTTIDDTSTISSSATSGAVAISAASSSSISNSGYYSDYSDELRKPIFVQEHVLNELKHCSVVLQPLPDVKNMAVWCMVHELYKCYCGGRAVEGRPLRLEKDVANSGLVGGLHDITPMGKQSATIATTNIVKAAAAATTTTNKVRYSFEKCDKSMSNANERQQEVTHGDVCMRADVDGIAVNNGKNDNASNTAAVGEQQRHESEVPLSPLQQRRGRGRRRSSVNQTNDSSIVTSIQPAQSAPSSHRLTATNVINSYVNSSPNICRRCVVVPHKAYLLLNRKRSKETRATIAQTDDARNKDILNDRISRSIYNHKHELELQRQRQQKQLNDCGNSNSNSNDKSNKSVSNWLTNNAERVSASLEEDPLLTERYSVMPSKRKHQCSQAMMNGDGLVDSSSSTSSTQKRSRLSHNESGTHQHHDDDDDGGGGSSGPDIISDFIDLTETLDDSPQRGAMSTDAAVASRAEKVHAAEVHLKVPKISSCISIHQSAATSPTSPTTATLPTIKRSSLSGMQNAASPQLTTAAASNATNTNMNCNNYRYLYNVIANMNSLVSKKMQDIELALKREIKIIPAPSEEILCIIKYMNFLDAYSQGFVYIWEVKMRDYSFFAATLTKQLPMVIGALGVVNIMALDSAHLPLMGRMLVQQFRSPATRKLAIVMQGRSQYWLIHGFLRGDSSQACVKPTPQSHPLLSKKINILCSILVKQHKNVQSYNTSVVQAQASQARLQSQQQQERQPQEEQQNVLAIHGQTSNSRTPQVPSSSSSSCSNSSNTKTATTSRTSQANVKLLGKLDGLNAHGYDGMKMNIEFRKLTAADMEELHPPAYHANDHRWLVLDLHNDFSHIFVPDFRDLISLDRIHKVMAFARQRFKIVKLQLFKNAPYDVYVTPNSFRKIYFGPLGLGQRPPLLILLQSVDGEMMLREIYQRKHNIQCNMQLRTSALWLVQINGQIQFDFVNDSVVLNGAIENEKLTVPTVEQERTAAVPTEESNDGIGVDECNKGEGAAHAQGYDSDDEDCVIIETSSPSPSPPSAVADPSIIHKCNAIEMKPSIRRPRGEASNPPQSTDFAMQANDDTILIQVRKRSKVEKSVSASNDTFIPTHAMANTPQQQQQQPSQLSGFVPLLELANSMNTQLNASGNEPSTVFTITSTREKVNAAVACPTSLNITSVANSTNNNIITNNNNNNKSDATSTAAMVALNRTQANKSQIAMKKQRRGHISLSDLECNGESNKSLDKGPFIPNVSKIGTTTITRLNGDDIRDICSSTTTHDSADGCKKYGSFASITIAKVQAGNGTVDAVNASNISSLNQMRTCTTAITTTATASNSSKINSTATSTASSSAPTTPNVIMLKSDLTIKKVARKTTSTTPVAISDSSHSIKRMLLNARKHVQLPSSAATTTTTQHKSLNILNLRKFISPTPQSPSSLLSSNILATSSMSNSSYSSNADLSDNADDEITDTIAAVTVTDPISKCVEISTTTRALTSSERSFVNGQPQNMKMRPVIRIRSAPRANDAASVVKVLPPRHQITAPSTTTSSTMMPSATPTNSVTTSVNIPLNVAQQVNGNTILMQGDLNTFKHSLRRHSHSSNVNATTTGGIISSSVSANNCAQGTSVSYGYFHSNLPGAPKFVVQRKNGVYLVKVRDVGIIQIQSIERVNAYLNRYLSKIRPNLSPQLPTVWQFVPQNKMKMQKSPSKKYSLQNQKLLNDADQQVQQPKLQLQQQQEQQRRQSNDTNESKNSIMTTLRSRILQNATSSAHKVTTADTEIASMPNNCRSIETEEFRTKTNTSNSFVEMPSTSSPLSKANYKVAQPSNVDTIVLE